MRLVISRLVLENCQARLLKSGRLGSLAAQQAAGAIFAVAGGTVGLEDLNRVGSRTWGNSVYLFCKTRTWRMTAQRSVRRELEGVARHISFADR